MSVYPSTECIQFLLPLLYAQGGTRIKKKRPGVNFFAKDIFGGPTN